MTKKADVKNVTDLNINKASKSELGYVKGCVENINDRIKELSVIQSEIT